MENIIQILLFGTELIKIIAPTITFFKNCIDINTKSGGFSKIF